MSSSSSSTAEADQDSPVPGEFLKTTYLSLPVSIPSSFLTSPAPDSLPPTAHRIDFKRTPLPEFSPSYAIILDNILSPSECATLLRLAESSVDTAGGKKTWKPALVNVGGGYEALKPEYRNSERIIWDEQLVVDRIWERCRAVEGVQADLESVVEKSRKGLGERWRFARWNCRMRFLKYTKGQFFRPHFDGPYSAEEDGKLYTTFYTVHLYLNDSVATTGPSAELVGGATSFLSTDLERKLNINPRAGRVLIFSHEGIYHSGDDVVKGTKYTMRTDIMYELLGEAGGA